MMISCRHCRTSELYLVRFYSAFIGLNWTVILSYIRLIKALKTLSCTHSVLSWPLTGNICLCVHPMGWGEGGMGCSEGCQILSSMPKQTHPSPGGYSQSGEMCSLTDESKQWAEPAASHLSGSLCRIFPLCLVKLYHHVLDGNSCKPPPIIHIINVYC